MLTLLIAPEFHNCSLVPSEIKGFMKTLKINWQFPTKFLPIPHWFPAVRVDSLIVVVVAFGALDPDGIGNW